MADAQDSKSCGRKVMWVRLPPPAQLPASRRSRARQNPAAARSCGFDSHPRHQDIRVSAVGVSGGQNPARATSLRV